MGWLSAQRRLRARQWRDAGQWLDGLPPALSRSAKLLEYDLALRYSHSGQLRDIFLGADQLPILSIPGWFLADLGSPADADHRKLDLRLVLAGLLLVARDHTALGMLDRDSFVDVDHIALVALFSERAVRVVGEVVPAASPFWGEYDSISLERAETLLERRERPPLTMDPAPPEACLGAGWSSTMRVLGAATISVARRADLLPGITAMLRALAAAFQIRAELETMHEDLLRGRISFPIAVTARAARIPLHPWPQPEVVLGAMVATRSLDTVLASAVGQLHGARRIAADLSLATFNAYLGDASAALEARIGSGFGGRGRGGRSSGSPMAGPLIVRAEPPLAKALAMADGFLHSDLTFRESWETHREGMFASTDVASRFPAGLVLEILSAHGGGLADQVEDFLSFASANGFRYYDHPWSGIDTDTIGVCLRLLPFSNCRDSHLVALDRVLGHLAGEVAARGSVPVWLRDGPEAPAPGRPVMDLGEGCGTVAAHLLLGLAVLDSERYRSTLDLGAAELLDRIGRMGLAANVNYPTHYALAAWFRLRGRLSSTGTAHDRHAANGVLDTALGTATRSNPRTAQAAALLVIACAEAGRPGLIDPGWIVTMLKQQRFDGSWIGEPFAAAPNRGRSTTWYSSTVLTSAFCCDALQRWARLGTGEPGFAVRAGS